MRIAMIGQKGVPATHGGVERHVEELGSRLVERGHDVVVFTRPGYTDPSLREHRGMRLVSLPTVPTKHLDAFVHSVLASVRVWGGAPDVVHYHAVGPCLASPLARLRGRCVVATIHGQDWRRAKWGSAASAILRLGEWMALAVPHRTIPVSEALAGEYQCRGKDVTHVPNGVTVMPGDDPAYLRSLGLRPGKYVLYAGRLVPEKGAAYLVEAWERIGAPMPLVVAGGGSFTDDYVTELEAHRSERVLFPGHVGGSRFSALLRNAALFALPSDLEGLPLVLLEALACGVPVLASDIAPNREVLRGRGECFAAGDVGSLASALVGCLSRLDEEHGRAALAREQVMAEYDWDRVVELTEAVYAEARAIAP